MGCNNSKKRDCIYYNYKLNNFYLCQCLINDSFNSNYHSIINICTDCVKEGTFGFLNLSKNFDNFDSSYGCISEDQIIKLCQKNNLDTESIKVILSKMKKDVLYEGCL